MNEPTGVEAADRIRAWLQATAPSEAPDRLLAETLDRTRAMRRGPFALERMGHMMQKAAILAAGAVAAVILVVALGGVVGRPSGGAAIPSGSPMVSAGTSAGPGSSPVAEPSRGASLGPSAPGSDGPPATASGRLAFHATVAGNTDIYLANGDGTGRVRLTTDPGVDAFPTWSPDGRLLTFTRAERVWIMNADGSAARQVTDSGMEDSWPSFHPDGKRIVFGRSTGPESAEIRIIDLTGASDERLFSDPTHLEAYGRVIDDELWTVRDRALGGALEIIAVNLATNKVRLITDPSDGEESSFAVSPDRRSIAYLSDAPVPGLLVMDADGGGAHLVASGASGGSMAWTSDSATLAFIEAGWIQLVRPDGTGLTRLIEGQSVDWDPSR